VVLGGKKLFADGSAPRSLKLTASRVAPNGLIVATTSERERSRGAALRSASRSAAATTPAPNLRRRAKKTT
jgi:hypothetical protein